MTLVKECSYCPVVPWLVHRLGVSEPPTASMSRGSSEVGAEAKERVAAALGLPEPWAVEKRLYSRRLRLRGTVDLVAGRGPYTVVEVKAFGRRAGRFRHFRSQLMVYALLVSDALGPVREAVLVMGRSVRRYPVTGEALREAERLVARTLEVVASEEPPETAATPGMCLYCWYRRLCPRRRA